MNKLERLYDKLCMKIVWNILPKNILMWCYYKIAADVTMNVKYSHMEPFNMKMMDCIGWWCREQGWPGHGSAVNDLKEKMDEIDKMISEMK